MLAAGGGPTTCILWSRGAVKSGGSSGMPPVLINCPGGLTPLPPWTPLLPSSLEGPPAGMAEEMEAMREAEADAARHAALVHAMPWAERAAGAHAQQAHAYCCCEAAVGLQSSAPERSPMHSQLPRGRAFRETWPVCCPLLLAPVAQACLSRPHLTPLRLPPLEGFSLTTCPPCSSCGCLCLCLLLALGRCLLLTVRA